MDVAIVIVGDEILQGHTQDTNSHDLARRLAALGVDLVEVRTVRDTPQAIQESVFELQERRKADVVVVAGGLGPTHDDRTVKAVANLHGVDVVPHEASWQRLLERYAARGGDDTTSLDPAHRRAAAKMTSVPRGATAFVNPVGAAPAFVLSRRLVTRPGQAWTAVAPGVPSELHGCWEEHLGPWLATLAGTGARVRHTVELHYHGYEAMVADHLVAVEKAHPGASIGSYPKWGRRLVVLRVAGPDAALVDAAAADLLARLHAAGLDAQRAAEDQA